MWIKGCGEGRKQERNIKELFYSYSVRKGQENRSRGGPEKHVKHDEVMDGQLYVTTFPCLSVCHTTASKSAARKSLFRIVKDVRQVTATAVLTIVHSRHEDTSAASL